MIVFRLLLLLLISTSSYALDLPEVLVETTKVVPYDTLRRVEGVDLLKNYQNDFKTNTLLLACYIHTQSIGKKDMNCLGDKYAIAQVIINRVKYKYRGHNNLREYLINESSTIKKMRTRYFWIDPKEYYSQQCLIAASNILKGNIPKEYDVGLCSRFQNNKKASPLKKPNYIKCKTFVHTFYFSKNFLKRIKHEESIF